VPQYFNSGTYIAGQSIAANIANTTVPLVEFINTATDQPVYTEIAFTIYPNAPSAEAIGLGIAPAQGVGPYNISPNSGAYDGVSAISAVQVATGWRIPPTTPTNFLRRMSMNSQNQFPAIPLIISFPRGLKLKPSTSLVLYGINFGAFRFLWGEYWVEFDE
jgi:hypothetical protein